MTPNQIAKESEHSQQVALFAYLAVAYKHGFVIADAWCEENVLPVYDPDELPAVPALEWIHAIPNGGSRGDDAKSRAIHGGKMKAEGVKSGIADIFLPWPKMNQWRTGLAYCGLYIEMKKPSLSPKTAKSKSGASDEQIKFGECAKRAGYGWIVCYDWREAANVIREYIEWGA